MKAFLLELSFHYTVFENLRKSRVWSNSDTRQVNFNRTKIGGNCQNWKFQLRHFKWFYKQFVAQKFFKRILSAKIQIFVRKLTLKKEPSDKPIFCKCKSYCAFANVKVANVQDNRLRSKNATFLLLLTYFFFGYQAGNVSREFIILACDAYYFGDFFKMREAKHNVSRVIWTLITLHEFYVSFKTLLQISTWRTKNVRI